LQFAVISEFEFAVIFESIELAVISDDLNQAVRDRVWRFLEFITSTRSLGSSEAFMHVAVSLCRTRKVTER